MIDKKTNNKIVYNNYQFYEMPALTGFIEKQASEGYSLYGAMGNFLDILKFSYVRREVPKSYLIFRKHLDEEIDEIIENMETGTGGVVWKNNLYIIFENTYSQIAKMKSEMIGKKQGILQGVAVKKSIAYVAALLLISVIGLALKIVWIKRGNLHFNLLILGLCFALLINFSLYLLGDLHDFILGKGRFIGGKIYFSSRTKVKDILFRMGDILKFGIVLGSIFISLALLLHLKDGVIAVDLLKMWLICCVIGYTSRIRYQGSYISLLLIEVFLITLGSI